MRHTICRNRRCSKVMTLEFGERRQYCSDACRQQAYRDRHKYVPVNRKPFFERYCVNCGRKFETKRPTKQFCHTSCRVSFHQQMKRLAAR